MSLLDRLSGRLGELLDDVTVPDRVRRRLDHAEATIAAGNPDAAIDVIRAVEHDRPNLWRAQFLLGLALEAAGRHAEAVRTWEHAITIRDHVVLRLGLGRVLYQLGDLRSARRHLETGLDRRPSDEDRLQILLTLADVLEALGPRSRAVPVLRHASRLAPSDQTIQVRLARALSDDDDKSAAIEVLQGLGRDATPAIDGVILLAELCEKRRADGDLQRAETAYQRALELRPDYPDALEGLARVYVDMGRIAEALPLFQQALTVADISAHPRLHLAVGTTYASAEQIEQALDAFRASTALDGGLAAAWTGIASTALRLDLVGEAEQASERAMELTPLEPEVRALRGRALIRADRVEEARTLLTPLRAAQMSVPVLRALGELALETDDPIEAIAMLREASLIEHSPALDVLLTRAYEQLAPNLPDLAKVERLSPPVLAPFLEALSGAVAAHPLLAELLPEATALRQQLDTPLAIAVLGEFNAGKSTLINAFVGEPMVATGVLPTTSHINVIRYGPRKVARWTHHDGSVEELPFEQAASLVKSDPESIAGLEFCYPHPDLRSIHFWDTPGFNAPNDDHEQRARVALRTADAVVWMLDANQALSSTEYERIREIRGASEKLLVVINKLDRLGGDSDALDEILEHVEGALEGQRVGVYPLSALVAYRSKQGDDEIPAHWQRFETALRTEFFDRSGRLKSLEVAAALSELVERVLRLADASLTQVREARTRISRERKHIAAREAAWPTRVLGPLVEDLNRDLVDVRAKTAMDVVGLVTPRSGILSSALLSSGTLHPEDAEQLIQRLEDAVRRALDRSRTQLAERLAEMDSDLVSLIEEMATQLGPPESRTLRRRIEAYLAETQALRLLLRERLVESPLRVIADRVSERSESVLQQLVSDGQRTEAEREAMLRALVPPISARGEDELLSWSWEYLAAARRLCDHVERDLDIVELDVEHRIARPFRMVLEALVPLVPKVESDG